VDQRASSKADRRTGTNFRDVTQAKYLRGNSSTDKFNVHSTSIILHKPTPPDAVF
jgi:hypothetical protein